MRLLFLMLALSGPGTSAAAADIAPLLSVCHFPAQSRSAEPPAWLLLSGALVLVGAGRLATR